MVGTPTTKPPTGLGGGIPPRRKRLKRLGKLLGTKGPGLIFLIPIVDRMVRMDLRVVTIDVARQEVMTRDNVPMSVDAVLYFRVIDPAAAVVGVEKYLKATSLISQTTLRSVLGQAELDELLSQRDKINLRPQEIIDRQTDPWGAGKVQPDAGHKAATRGPRQFGGVLGMMQTLSWIVFFAHRITR